MLYSIILEINKSKYKRYFFEVHSGIVRDKYIFEDSARSKFPNFENSIAETLSFDQTKTNFEHRTWFDHNSEITIEFVFNQIKDMDTAI